VIGNIEELVEDKSLVIGRMKTSTVAEIGFANEQV